MSVKIKFINTASIHDVLHPVPSKSMIPDWYKDTQGDAHSTRPDGPLSTVKRCMPVFDSITAGYLLLTHEDIIIEGPNNEAPYFHWMDKDAPSVSFHSSEQARKYPGRHFDVPKYKNKWGIVTEPGYSCLFIDPTHRDSPIRILEGIVDTDTYNDCIEFPFMLKDQKWRGTIPAGTPIAQVIPFKRESFSMEVSESQEDLRLAHKGGKLVRSIYVHAYKKMLWSKKDYS
jgi:hypothetical protein